MNIYTDRMPKTCFECPLVVSYQGTKVECILYKNQWRSPLHTFDETGNVISFRLPNCKLKEIAKTADNLTEEEVNNLLDDLIKKDIDYPFMKKI